MGSLGLGACLADDMGLGKTMQLLAFLLAASRTRRAMVGRRCSSRRRRWSATGSARSSASRRRSTSCATTAPSVRARRRPSRTSPAPLVAHDLRPAAARRRAAVERSTGRSSRSTRRRTSRTPRRPRRAPRAALRASHRFALTGTPVENRLAELWSILEFANPGLLGPLETFRRDFARAHRALRQRRRGHAPAPHREPVHPAPAQERSDHHPGPPAQERDEGRLHADARAGDALQGRRRRGAAAHRVVGRASSAAGACSRC